MGAIQDSINSMISTTAVGIAGAKHAFDRAADKVAAAKEGAVKVGEEIPELAKQKQAAENQVGKVNSDVAALNELGANPDAIKGPEDVKAWHELEAEVNVDKKMAETALLTVEGKMKARTEMLARFDKTLASKGWR